MTDDTVRTLRGSFATREAAVEAVEHLVQQHGIPRDGIFVRAAGSRNSAGTRPSGSDAAHMQDKEAPPAPLNGAIEVSVDVSEADRMDAEKVFRDAGGRDVTIA